MFFHRDQEKARAKELKKKQEKLRQDFLEACESGKREEVEKFIAGGADVNDYNGGRTPLYYAVLANNLEAVRVLLDKGARVNARVAGVNGSFGDYTGTTPLLIAAQRKYGAMAMLLIDRGADVTAADHYKLTALHYAAKRGDEALARCLIDEGADVFAQDKWKRTPEYYAFLNDHRALGAVLSQQTAQAPNPHSKPRPHTPPPSP